MFIAVCVNNIFGSVSWTELTTLLTWLAVYYSDACAMNGFFKRGEGWTNYTSIQQPQSN